MVQRRVVRFVKGRYGMFESVTPMSEQLARIPQVKICKTVVSFSFTKLSYNCCMPHSCLEKADVRTRKNHFQKFRHIGYNVDPYRQSFFPNHIGSWNGLSKDIAEDITLDIFKSKLQN